MDASLPPEAQTATWPPMVLEPSYRPTDLGIEPGWVTLGHHATGVCGGIRAPAGLRRAGRRAWNQFNRAMFVFIDPAGNFAFGPPVAYETGLTISTPFPTLGEV